MLDGVANGKRLPEKNLLILGSSALVMLPTGALIYYAGGTPESQREFLETLSVQDPSLPNEKRKGRTPPIANQFALGYTYQDVLDADHEGR